MGSTNKTANIGLSQFIGTDKPTWLVDYNGDMSTIDEAIGELQNDSGLIDTAIAELQTNVQNLQSGQGDSATEIAEVKSSVQTISANYEQIHHETVLLAEEVRTMDDKFLPLSGGTVEGDIVNVSSVFRMNSDNLTKGEIPTSDKYMQLRFQDAKNTGANKDCLARLVYAVTSSGSTNLDLIACKNEADSLSIAKLSVGFDSNGNEFAQAPSPKSANDNSKSIATTEWINNRYGNFRIYSGTIASGKTLNIGLQPYAGMYELMTGHSGDTTLCGDYKVFGTNANANSVITPIKESANLTVTATKTGLTVENKSGNTVEYTFVRYYCGSNTDVSFS